MITEMSRDAVRESLSNLEQNLLCGAFEHLGSTVDCCRQSGEDDSSDTSKALRVFCRNRPFDPKNPGLGPGSHHSQKTRQLLSGSDGPHCVLRGIIILAFVYPDDVRLRQAPGQSRQEQNQRATASVATAIGRLLHATQSGVQHESQC